MLIVGGGIVAALHAFSGSSPPFRPAAAWTNVVDDQFNGSTIPRHWRLYHAPYGDGPHNCTSATHDYVSDGSLHLVEHYEHSAPPGVSCPYEAGWYTGGMKLDPVAPYVGDDQRVTLRYRIVSRGGVVSHHIIPMRWPADQNAAHGTHMGEEEFLETDTVTSGHFLLYGRDAERIRSSLYRLDMTQWHTVRFTQLSHTVYAYFDDMTTPLWTYHGSSATIPNLPRTTVLQQECSHTNGCPRATTGREDIQIDWIKVDTAPAAGRGRRGRIKGSPEFRR